MGHNLIQANPVGIYHVQEELGRGDAGATLGPQKLVASAIFPLESQLEVFSDRIFTSLSDFFILAKNPKTIPNNSKYYCCSFSG